MKKMKLLIVVALQLLTIGLVAQTPQLINYQGVARDSNGSPISGNIGIKFEFRTGSASGAVVFTETQNLTTNGLGIFNTQIGKVNTSGISTLNWQGSNMFLEVSIDAAGGTSYVQERMPVPIP